ncbi:hypothetical protein [Dyadobacter psychrotolerans]|uniref:Uncharacterized protein n=1 Tax=Dyadobacter psychrotolerans TaxID=2541721 RepID=A0A4R5DR55_9BACT|nr:hypothetical protein [Dyadobacter psychrotolerans]TDE14531.1 hypothetical protein E0F88_15140 [Dyadobacter psychrotolerans]
MKPYSDYSAEELAMENLFIRWVRFPDDPSIRAFWENWIIKYPYMKENVDRARELVLTASDWKPDMLSNQEVNSIWGRIRSSLEIIGEKEPIHPAVKSFGAGNIIKGIVLLIMSLTFLFFLLWFFV